MSTTVIFAEILIIGIQATFWVTILIGAVFGWELYPPLIGMLKANKTIFGIIYLALSYTLGILVDATTLILSRAFKPQKLLLKWGWLDEQVKATDLDQRMEIIRIEGQGTQFLAYVRSRLRILRGTFLNLLLFSLSWLILTTTRGGFPNYTPSRLTSILLCSVAIIVSIYCLCLASVVDAAHDNRLDQLLRRAKGQQNTPADAKNTRR